MKTQLFEKKMQFNYTWQIFTILIAIFYTAAFFYRLWFPWDDATLALLAQNVLSGDIPHRDFDEPYTGGLTYLNSLAFYLFGPSLLALRIPFYITGILAFYTLYIVASRILTHKTALLISALCWIVSVPVYSVPMPSWYNLFFFIFALYASLRFVESKSLSFLFIAGILSGLSILIKISGVFLVGCMLLYIYYLNLSKKTELEKEYSFKGYEKCIHLLGIIFIIGIFFVVLIDRTASQEFLFFLLPLVFYLGLLGRLIVNKEEKFSYSPFFVELVFFSLGVFVVLISYTSVFVINNSVEEMINGVLIAPLLRVESPYNIFPSIFELIYLLPFFVLFLPKFSYASRALVLIATISVSIILLLVTNHHIFYEMIWFWLRSIPLIISITVFLNFKRWERRDKYKTHLVMLISFSSFFMSLIQFPNPHGIYWLYSAPLLILCSFVIFSLFVEDKKPIISLGVCFFVFFVLVIQNEKLSLTGMLHITNEGWHSFSTKKERVFFPDASLVNDLSDLNLYIEDEGLQNHLFCTPDCAHVYYFTGTKNPMRWLFEVLDNKWTKDNEAWVDDLTHLLKEKEITHIVVNIIPSHSRVEYQPLITKFEKEGFLPTQIIGRFLILGR